LKQDKRYLKQALIMADRSVQLALQVRPDHPGVNKMMANIDKTIADIRLSMAFDGTQEEVNL
jgi:hypothetical protein